MRRPDPDHPRPRHARTELTPNHENPGMHVRLFRVTLALVLAAPVVRAQAPNVRSPGFPLTAPAAPTTFVIDQAHTNVAFKVRHLGISTVTGRFARFSGSFLYDSLNPGASRVDVTIDAASVDTDIERRDEHLRSEDFFHVAQFPSITFISRTVNRVGPSRFRVLGDLTIRGVTKPVVLDAELGGVLTLQSGGAIAALRATTTIDRFDYGLAWNRMTEGVANVAPEVQIELDIEAKRAPPAP